MPKDQNVVTTSDGRQSTENGNQEIGKRSQLARKKAIATSNELRSDFQVGNMPMMTSEARSNTNGGAASKPPSMSLTKALSPTSSPHARSGHIEVLASSDVTPLGSKSDYKNGMSSQAPGKAKSPRRKAHRTTSNPQPSEQDDKRKGSSSGAVPSHMEARSMSVPSIKSLSLAKQPAIAAYQAYIPVEPKVNKRFYEALIMLSILGKNRGGRIPEKPFQHRSGLESEKGTLRRLFIRSLAYLCDSEKGGQTTTAIALQQAQNGGVVYWVASNCHSAGSKKDRSKHFMEGVLGTVQSSLGMDHARLRVVEMNILDRAVSFSEGRLKVYRTTLKSQIENVIGYFMEEGIPEDPLIGWLRKMQSLLKDPNELCNFCYEDRQSVHCFNLTERARAGGICAQRFKRIRHIIGRLAHTKKAVVALVTSGSRLPHLLSDFSVTRTPSGYGSPPPLQERNPTLVELAGRMTSNKGTIETIRHSLADFDRLVQLSEELQRSCKSRTWRPQVHAELLLNDLFVNRKFKFVDGDRYIACSKAACFCCYHYIKAQGQFVVPGCHNNVWVNWKAPDILNQPQNEPSVMKRKRILNIMTKHIRAAVLNQIIYRQAPMTWKPDTATEISSVRMQDMRSQIAMPIEELNATPGPNSYANSSPGSEGPDYEEQDDTNTGFFDEDEDSDECEPELQDEGDLTERFESFQIGDEHETGGAGYGDLENGYWSDDKYGPRDERCEPSDDEVHGRVSFSDE
ncbi:hypothetical protein ONS96_004816 [Cadophora gregata f. sp. sojae]|nr:hypothetical protein ONS96_004816 [Cadophora gregata f. sp. sojae]